MSRPLRVLVVGQGTVSITRARMAVEASGLDPVLPADGEDPVSALQQIRPTHVLLDADHSIASDPAFYRDAIVLQTHIALYSMPYLAVRMRTLALQFGMKTIDVPCGTVGFLQAVEDFFHATEWSAAGAHRRSLDGSDLSARPPTHRDGHGRSGRS